MTKTEDCLTNLRFADDVLLFSTSLGKLREMLCDVKTSTEAVGLGIHPDKTKVLSNQDKVKAKVITVDNIQIEILAKGDSARYLGQKITFEDQETAEIKNRLKAAWAAFHRYRQEMTSKGYRLCHRLRLLNMVVTPTLTYASGTWTLTQKHEKMIKTAQRKNASSHSTDEQKIQDKKESNKQKRRGARNAKRRRQRETPLKKTLKTTHNKTQTKIRIVMYLSRKKLMKKLTPPKMKKIGSNSSKDVPKKLKNIWKNTRYHAGLKYTGDQMENGTKNRFST